MKFIYEGEQRLDSFLADYISDLSRSQIQKLIKIGKVTIDGEVITKSKKQPLEGSKIKLENKFIKKEIKGWNKLDLLNIIDETKDYMIINKPSGLVVHPGNGNPDKTLVNILEFREMELSNVDEQRPGIVHRIDKDTSGLMIIAKNNIFHKYIQSKFEERNIEKKYIGLVSGNLQNKNGMVDAPIGRDENDRIKMKITSKNSKESQTIFKVKERFDQFDLVEYKLLTGRTHQIRVHSLYMGAPIHNDKFYGETIDQDNLKFGQFLHASKLTFKNMEGNKVTYEAKLPKIFNQKIKQLKGKK